ncbi:uncharacterized protein LOC132555707 [Ylistrum balloti]|uniref:uncharacterized protein LOC132555707 n=1 Tax=Ylistrum balloti TaxID=509963 RepID=UPI002905D539|nr:uncharacterized protein LOC132555707 [Ylistrum balloti]
MYRLYRMSTRRRRRPKPQTGQNGQTSPNGPSTISVSNGGTQNRAFSEEQGTYPRSRRRAPATAETPMHQEQLSKPPRPGHLDSRRTDTNPSAPSEINNIQGDPPPKYGNIDSPQGQNYLGSKAKPSIPVHELDTRRLENQPNTSYKHLPLGGNAQSYEPEKVTRSEQHRTMPDITKAHTDLNDKSYQALGKRQDEHTYTTPTNVNQRDRYELPKDRRERHNLKSDSRLGPPSQSRQYNGDRKTSQPSDRQFPHLSDKQTEQHSGNRNTSHPTHPSDKNTSYHPDRQISHPSNRDTSHTSHPPNTSYPSDRQTSHPSTNTNKDAQYLREPRPSYPSTNDGRSGPGYHAYNPSPGRGAPPRQPEYESSSSRQGNRDYRPTNDYRGVNLGKPGGTRQSQI